ncbi:MAG TPA: carboxypeptidase regulatory-like domain-containing protein [Chthoniobacterales bacterium]|jgi:phosphatidate phosphatase APP1|nr:carboxypeptidase regulatory-like domain-containing protein [Chthoniobacterales bacterium]
MFVLLSACVPYHSHDAPHVAGRIVSRATGEPIAGATVSMTADPGWGGKTVRAYTDARGYFTLPEIHHWFIAPLSDGIVEGEGTLVVEASGYRAHRERRERSTETLTIPLAPKT